MPKIPFTMRRSGRYYFRKRARWQNGNDVTAIASLETCCAQEARIRGAAGHDEWAIEEVACELDQYCNRDLIADDIMEIMAESPGG